MYNIIIIKEHFKYYYRFKLLKLIIHINSD